MGCMCPCLRTPITVKPCPNKKDNSIQLPISLRSVAESPGSVTLKDSIDGSKQLNNFSARNSVIVSTYRSSRKLEIVSKDNSPNSKRSQYPMLRDVMYPDVNCTISVRVLPQKSSNTASKSASNSNSLLFGPSQSMRVIRTEQQPRNPKTVDGSEKSVPESPPKAQVRSFRHLRIEHLDEFQTPNIKLNKPSQFSPLRKPSESRLEPTKTRPRTNTAPSYNPLLQAQPSQASQAIESAIYSTQPKPQRSLESPWSVRLMRSQNSPNKNLPLDAKVVGDIPKLRSRSPRKDSQKKIQPEHGSPGDSSIKSKISKQSPPQKSLTNSKISRADSMFARDRAIQRSEEHLAVLPTMKALGQSPQSELKSTLLPTTTALSQEALSLGTKPQVLPLEVATRGDCLSRSNTLCKPELSKADSGQFLRKTQTCVYNRPEELSFCAISEKSGENSEVLIPNFDPDLDDALRA